MDNILLHRLAYALVHKFQITVPEGQEPEEFEDDHLDQIKSYVMSLNDRQLGQIFAGLGDLPVSRLSLVRPHFISGRDLMRQIIVRQIIDRMCELLGPTLNRTIAYEHAESESYYRSVDLDDD